MRAVNWARDYWYIPLAVVVLLFLGVLYAVTVRRTSAGKLRTPLAELRKELKVIEAGRKAREAAVDVGTERAVEAIRTARKDALDRMSAKQLAKADRLRSDPRGLARFLERVGSK